MPRARLLRLDRGLTGDDAEDSVVLDSSDDVDDSLDDISLFRLASLTLENRCELCTRTVQDGECRPNDSPLIPHCACTESSSLAGF